MSFRKDDYNSLSVFLKGDGVGVQFPEHLVSYQSFDNIVYKGFKQGDIPIEYFV